MVTKLPHVSVVVPHYDDVDTLAVALKSALDQSFADLELILVDDASSRNVDAVIAEIKDSRLRIVRHDRNRGAAAARNTGVAAAQGEYIAFLDADDSWYPTKLERQLARMEDAGSSVDACCCAYLLLRRDGRWELLTPPPDGDWYRHLLWGCNLSPGSTLLVRRSSFNEIGPFDEMLPRMEDWDWLLRFAMRFRLVTVAEPLARIQPGTSPHIQVVTIALDRIAEKHLPLAKARGRGPWRQLLAALWLERAAAAYRDRQYGHAAARLLRSFVVYPLRNKTFYSRLLHQLGLVIRVAARRAVSR